MKNKSYNQLTDEDKKSIIDSYYSDEYANKKFYEIANELNVSERGYSRVLKEANINTHLKRRYCIENNNYFDNINNERKAYFFGLLFADGHNGDNNDVSIQLKDIGNTNIVLNELKKDLGIKNLEVKKIQKRNIKFLNERIYHGLLLNVSDEYLSNSLKNKGMNGLKVNTRKNIPSEILDNNLFNHFLRGLFDGDGTFTERFIPNYDETSLLNKSNIGFMGSYELLCQIKLLLEKNVKTNPKVKIRPSSNSEKIYELRYKGDQTFKIAYFMYKNATIYLSHKVPYGGDVIRKRRISGEVLKY